MSEEVEAVAEATKTPPLLKLTDIVREVLGPKGEPHVLVRLVGHPWVNAVFGAAHAGDWDRARQLAGQGSPESQVVERILASEPK